MALEKEFSRRAFLRGGGAMPQGDAQADERGRQGHQWKRPPLRRIVADAQHALTVDDEYVADVDEGQAGHHRRTQALPHVLLTGPQDC